MADLVRLCRDESILMSTLLCQSAAFYFYTLLHCLRRRRMYNIGEFILMENDHFDKRCCVSWNVSILWHLWFPVVCHGCGLMPQTLPLNRHVSHNRFLTHVMYTHTKVIDNFSINSRSGDNWCTSDVTVHTCTFKLFILLYTPTPYVFMYLHFLLYHLYLRNDAPNKRITILHHTPLHIP